MTNMRYSHIEPERVVLWQNIKIQLFLLPKKYSTFEPMKMAYLRYEPTHFICTLIWSKRLLLVFEKLVAETNNKKNGTTCTNSTSFLSSPTHPSWNLLQQNFWKLFFLWALFSLDGLSKCFKRKYHIFKLWREESCGCSKLWCLLVISF